MIISPHTKIAKLLKENPDSLEAIVSLAPKFERLRNPLLRKLLAGRTTISMAAKVGGCKVEDFFEKLKPLGFEVDENASMEQEEKQAFPKYLQNVKKDKIVELDVRPIIDAGKDPLGSIMKSAKSIPSGGALKVINSFEPTPLIAVLEKQGYQYYVDFVEDNNVQTWFYKEGSDDTEIEVDDTAAAMEGFEEKMKEYEGRMVEIDVRHLQMPMPMHTILETLADMDESKALYVNHKRIPVFLLPELRDAEWEYRIKEIDEGNVKLLIYKK